MHKGRQFRAAIPYTWYQNHVSGDHVPMRLLVNGLWYVSGQLVELQSPAFSVNASCDRFDLLYEWDIEAVTNFGKYKMEWRFAPVPHQPHQRLQVTVADFNDLGFRYTWEWHGAQGGFYLGSQTIHLKILEKIENFPYKNSNATFFIRGVRYSEE